MSKPPYMVNARATFPLPKAGYVRPPPTRHQLVQRAVPLAASAATRGGEQRSTTPRGGDQRPGVATSPPGIQQLNAAVVGGGEQRLQQCIVTSPCAHERVVQSTAWPTTHGGLTSVTKTGTRALAEPAPAEPQAAIAVAAAAASAAGVGAGEPVQIPAAGAFAKTEPLLLQLFASASTPLRAKPGDFLVRAGDVEDSLFIVISGEVEVLKYAVPGRKPFSRVIRGPSYFGEATALGIQHQRTHNVKALGVCQLLVLEGSILRSLLHRFPEEQLRFTLEARARLAAMAIWEGVSQKHICGARDGGSTTSWSQQSSIAVSRRTSKSSIGVRARSTSLHNSRQPSNEPSIASGKPPVQAHTFRASFSPRSGDIPASSCDVARTFGGGRTCEDATDTFAHVADKNPDGHISTSSSSDDPYMQTASSQGGDGAYNNVNDTANEVPSASGVRQHPFKDWSSTGRSTRPARLGWTPASQPSLIQGAAKAAAGFLREARRGELRRGGRRTAPHSASLGQRSPSSSSSERFIGKGCGAGGAGPTLPMEILGDSRTRESPQMRTRNISRTSSSPVLEQDDVTSEGVAPLGRCSPAPLTGLGSRRRDQEDDGWHLSLCQEAVVRYPKALPSKEVLQRKVPRAVSPEASREASPEPNCVERITCVGDGPRSGHGLGGGSSISQPALKFAAPGAKKEDVSLGSEAANLPTSFSSQGPKPAAQEAAPGCDMR